MSDTTPSTELSRHKLPNCSVLALVLICLCCISCISKADSEQKHSESGDSVPLRASPASANRLLSITEAKKFHVAKPLHVLLNDVQWKGNFEMGCLYEGKWICAISYKLFSENPKEDRGSVVWAIFIDNKFEKFVRWPKWEMVTTNFDGSQRSDPKPIKVGNFDRLIGALKGPSIDLQKLEEEWNSRPKVPAQYDPGLTVTGIMLSPLLGSASEKDYRENVDLRDQFNAARLEFKMSGSQVESVFHAKALQSGNVDAGRYSIFGELKSFKIVHSLHYANVLVLFESGEVTGIYSGETIPGGADSLQEIRKIFIDLPKQ